MRTVKSGWFGDHVAELTEPVQVERYGTIIGTYVPAGFIGTVQVPIVVPRDMGTQVIGEGARNIPPRSLGAHQTVHEVLARVNRGKVRPGG